MGADGGVVYMKLRNPSKFSRLLELINPFYFLTESGNADWQQDTCDKFWESSPIGAPEYLCGTYGTSQDFDISDLRDILDPDYFENEIADPSLTFVELVEDLQTRPFGGTDGKWCYLTDRITVGKYHNYYDSGAKRLSLLEKMLWDVVCWRLNDLPKTLGPISNMTISSWLSEMREILEYKNVFSEETWT